MGGGGGSWGDTGQTREIDYGGEIDFDISGITLESGGTSEGQVCGWGGAGVIQDRQEK